MNTKKDILEEVEKAHKRGNDALEAFFKKRQELSNAPVITETSPIKKDSTLSETTED